MKSLLPFTFTFFICLTCHGCQNKTPDFSNHLVDLERVDLTETRPNIPLEKARDTLIETAAFEFSFVETQLSVEEMTSLVTKVEANYRKINSILGFDPLVEKVDYTIFPSIEKKGLALQNGAIAQVSHTQQKVFAVSSKRFQGHLLCPEFELLIRKKLGKSNLPPMEKGLSIFLNPDWQKKGFDHWAKRLFHSENLPLLKDIFDQEMFEKESDLVLGVAAASFVDYLISEQGLDAFLRGYMDFEVKEEELSSLQNQWMAFLGDKYGKSEELERKKEVPMLKGFNFAHEGYRVYNGYGSQLAENSISRMVEIGCNAVAIVPYSYMRSDANPTFLPIMRRAGTETDESVMATHLQAKQWNAFTILKPQIWLRGSWPGNIKMQSQKDWDLFFDYYYRWMRHYALLAEIWEIDMLCVGVEFAEATKNQPEKWRQLIRKLRGIYSGPMIYAANWGSEFENIAFWDELDYIGLNCYYPLSKQELVDRKTLENGFKETIKKIERVCNQFEKPLIFTEIGFRSVNHTWVQPHEEANGRAVDEEGQRLCYDIVLSQVTQEEWYRGILWWKWPSYMNYDNRRGTGFTPSGKLAETVVENWFLKEGVKPSTGE